MWHGAVIQGRRRGPSATKIHSADVARRYVEEHAKKHNKSWEQADTLVRRFAIPRWGKLQAAAITRADVKTLMGKIAAPISANQTLAAISAVYTWAVKEELVPANPARGVIRNPTKTRERVLGASELSAVLGGRSTASSR